MHLGKLCLLSSARGKNACDLVPKQRADGSRFPWNTKREGGILVTADAAADKPTPKVQPASTQDAWQSSEFPGWRLVPCFSACHLSNTSEHGTNRQPKVSLVTEFQVKSATPTSLRNRGCWNIIYYILFLQGCRCLWSCNMNIFTLHTFITVPAVKSLMKAHMPSLLVTINLATFEQSVERVSIRSQRRFGIRLRLCQWIPLFTLLHLQPALHRCSPTRSFCLPSTAACADC